MGSGVGSRGVRMLENVCVGAVLILLVATYFMAAAQEWRWALSLFAVFCIALWVATGGASGDAEVWRDKADE